MGKNWCLKRSYIVILPNETHTNPMDYWSALKVFNEDVGLFLVMVLKRRRKDGRVIKRI